MKLRIANIRRDGGTQFRQTLHEDVIEEYAAALKRGEKLPDPVAFHDGTDHWLADGFHTTAAYEKNGVKQIEIDVRQGTRRDAVLYAATEANKTHGLRFTNEEKRARVRALLEDEEWAKWSDREIGRKCGVSYEMVRQIRKSPQLSTVDSSEDTGRMGADGKVRKLPERKTAPLMSSDSMVWLTPPEVRDPLIAFAGPAGIERDPCSHRLSIIPAGVRWYGPPGVDGLTQEWDGGLSFVNPPYGRNLADWADKIRAEACPGESGMEGEEIIVLVPVRTDTEWWADLMQHARGWVAVKGRLRFLEPVENWEAREQERAKERREKPRPPPPEAFPGLVRTDPAPFPSAVFYFGERWDAFCAAFGHLGAIQGRPRSVSPATERPAKPFTPSLFPEETHADDRVADGPVGAAARPEAAASTEGGPARVEGVVSEQALKDAAARGYRTAEQETLAWVAGLLGLGWARFDCPTCGEGVKADEDACCTHCGADCERISGPPVSREDIEQALHASKAERAARAEVEREVRRARQEIDEADIHASRMEQRVAELTDERHRFRAHIDELLDSILKRPGMYGSAESVTDQTLLLLGLRAFPAGDRDIVAAWRSYEHRVCRGKPGPLSLASYLTMPEGVAWLEKKAPGVWGVDFVAEHLRAFVATLRGEESHGQEQAEAIEATSDGSGPEGGDRAAGTGPAGSGADRAAIDTGRVVAPTGSDGAGGAAVLRDPVPGDLPEARDAVASPSFNLGDRVVVPGDKEDRKKPAGIGTIVGQDGPEVYVFLPGVGKRKGVTVPACPEDLIEKGDMERGPAIKQALAAAKNEMPQRWRPGLEQALREMEG